MFGTGALAYIYYEGPLVWRFWFPEQPVGPVVKRYVIRVSQALVVAFAYVQARFYINLITGVDPGNFPTALTALTVLSALTVWPVFIAAVGELMFVVYVVVGWIAGVGGGTIGGVSHRRWGFRAFGAFSIVVICSALYLGAATHPGVQRVVRTIATSVLIATQFSYDQTCAVSSEERLVARLQDRKEMKASLVSIVEGGPFRETRFTTGTCDQAMEP